MQQLKCKCFHFINVIKLLGFSFAFICSCFPFYLYFISFSFICNVCCVVFLWFSLHSLILCTIKQETFYKIICRTLLAPKHFPFAYISENEENYEGAIENYTVKFVNFFEGIFLMLSTELLFIWYNDCLLLLLLLHCFLWFSFVFKLNAN